MFLRAELRRRRRLAADDAGFTLIEVVVALLVLTIAASGTVLVLASGSRAAGTSRLNTQAKNLAQQRVESMRDLEFHVDRQNGPYVDLLDLYYTNLSTTATTRTRGAITDSDGTETQSVRWFSSGTAPNPTDGPFYQVSVSRVPGYSGFSQVVDTQFLDASGDPVPASDFTSYDSQTQGKDSPPSQLVGVTVITSWTDHGSSKSYTLSTRITDGRAAAAGITSQGIGEYLRVTSSRPGAEPNSLSVDVNRSEADGGQTTGSSATASTKAFEAADAGADTDVLGANGVATSPGSTSTTTPVSAVNSSSSASGGCGWATAGRSTVSDVTAATTSGLPQVPSDVGSQQTTPAATTSSSLMANAGGGCGALWFDNQSTSYDSDLMLNSAEPLVGIPDTTSGSGAVTTGSSWVNASNSVTTPHWVSSGASVSTTSGSNATVELFPGLPFVTGGGGLVNVTVSSASLSCLSTVPSGGTTTFSATASYTGTLSYWRYNNGSPGYASVPLSWTSSTASSDPLASVPLSTVVYQNAAQNPTTVLHLSDYISSWSTARSIVEQTNNGLHQVPGVVDITTMPVRTDDATSSIGVEVGDLSCAAEDDR